MGKLRNKPIARPFFVPHDSSRGFILHVIMIKCIGLECMQENIEFSCMLQRPRLILTKILGDLSLATIRGGARNFPMMGLKYDFLGTINARNSQKNHLSPSDGGASML